MTRQPRTVTRPAALSSLTGYLVRRAHARSMDHARASLDPAANLRDAAILTVLEDDGPMSQRAAADVVEVSRTIMVKLVDALESEGYVVRERNPANRRAYALTITARGRKRRAQLFGEFDDAEATLIARLSTAERERLDKWLRRLLEDGSLTEFPSMHRYTGYLISIAHQQLSSRAERLLASLGIHPRDFGALTTVARENPCSQQTVADALGTSAPIALWLIDDLERDGLVRRARNAADRRSYDLTLTADGVRRLAKASEIVATEQQRIVARLGVRGDRELRRLLSTIGTD